MKWTSTKLGDFAPFVYGKGLPKAKRISGNVPVYGSNGIVGMHSESFVSQPAVIIGRKGSVGEVHLANGPSWPIDTAFFVLGSKEVDLHFLYYLLKTLPITSNSDSAVPGLNRDFAHSLEIRVPDIHGQIAIGEVLSSLDKKIAANNALSKTLEEIAQTIFKSWFIDFDPVKAKMAGAKPAGMDAATAALFPDSMEESDLGLIPKGWKVRSIGDSVIKQKVGKLFDSKTSFPDGAVPVLDQGKSGVVGFHDEEAGVFASPDMPLVVFANHTCSLRLISYPFSVIQNVFPLIGDKVDVIWLYFAVEGKQQFDSYKGHWPDFVLHKIIHPTEQATNAFRLTVESLLKQKWLLEQQSKMLASLRDSLLPRLISGELQIPDELLAS